MEAALQDAPPNSSSHACLPCSSIKTFFVNEVVSLFQKPVADVSKIMDWCDWLVCPSTTEHSSQQQLMDLKQSGTKRVCGHVFRQGEIAYNCITCQTDSTCVICYDCFKNGDTGVVMLCTVGDHLGHEYYSHKTGAGGCCDCGDIEAWAVLGFCRFHSGTAIQNALPAQMNERASETIEAVVAHISRSIHKSQAAASGGIGDLASPPLCSCGTSASVLSAGGQKKSDDMHIVVLHSDDVHTFEEVAHVLLAIVGASDIDAEQLAHLLDTKGEAIVKRGSQEACHALHEQITAAAAGNSIGLMVSVHSELMERDEDLCVQLLQWLSQLLLYSDSLMHLVACALQCEDSHAPTHSQAANRGDSTRLDAWISSDLLLRHGFGSALHQLYMQLIPDASFKATFAKSLLQCYCDLSTNFVRGRGKSENSIFNLTVQLFTVPSLVPQLVLEQDLLQIIFGSIGAAVSSAVDNRTKRVDPTHSVVKNARYAHLLNDLRYSLSMPGSARQVTCGDSRLLASWLQMLALVQLMDPIEHQTGAHVEYESDSWLHAFDLSIKLGPIQALIVDGFVEACNDLPHDQKCQNAHSVVSMCCSTINSWAGAQDLPVIELSSPLGAASVFDVDIFVAAISFHLPLHRFLTLLLLQCITRLQIDPAEFLRLKYLPPSFVALLMEWPLQCIVVAAQTKIGLWKRNGHTIQNQVINYQHSAVAAQMFDLDLPLIQFGASTLPPSMFLSTVLRRFGLFEWWWHEDDASGSKLDLAHEFLSVLVVTFSEMHWYCGGEGFLQRELIHKMLVGPCTHSKLRECVSSFGNRKGSPTTEEFDMLVNKLASFHTPTKVSQGKYTLKDDYKQCYDPYFFRLTREQHQIVSENLSRKGDQHQSGAVDQHQSAAPLCLPKAMHGMAAILLSSEIAEMLWLPIRDFQQPNRCSSELLQAALHLLKLSTRLLEDDDMPAEWRNDFVTALQCDRGGGSSIVSSLCNLSTECNNQHAKHLVQMLSGFCEVCKSLCLIEIQQSENTARSEEQAQVAQTAAASSKEAKKLAARKRAMKAMQKKRDRFSKTQASVQGVHNPSNPPSNSSVNVPLPDANSPELLCILCCEEGDKGVLGHLAFAQMGGPLRRGDQRAVHIQFCSHCMHVACHTQYLRTLAQRHSGMASFEGEHVIDLADGEFLCPMCKSVCNLLVPSKQHESEQISLPVTESQLVENVGNWFDAGCTNQLKCSAFDNSDDDYSLVMAKQIADRRQSESSTLTPVAALSHCWLSVSYMVASIWLSCSKKPESGSVSAMRSLVHNVRALSKLLRVEPSSLSEQFVKPIQCLLEGGSSHTRSDVVPVLAGPTLLSSNILELMLTLMLLAPSAQAAVDTMRALFVVAIVQASMSPVDDANCPSVQVQSSVAPDLEAAAASAHNSVCEFAGIAPRFGSHGAMAAIQRRCQGVLQQADILFELCYGAGSLDFSGQQLDMFDICNKYGLPTVEVVSRCVVETDTGSSIIGTYIRQWCMAVGIGSGAVAAEEVARGLVGWSLVPLMDLPSEYDDLYGKLSQFTCPTSTNASDEPTICLVCGMWLCGGTSCCRQNGQGACTYHAKMCSAGVGMFLVIKKCQVVMLRSSWSAFYPAPYLDVHGEEDKGLKRGCRLVLSVERYNELRALWSSHSVVREISRIRNQSDRVIRQNYF